MKSINLIFIILYIYSISIISGDETCLKQKDLSSCSYNEMDSTIDSMDTKTNQTQLNDKRYELEDFTTLSNCHLWKLMMSYYDRKGVNSWADIETPSFITSNAFIGHKYAKLVQGFLQDGLMENSKMQIDKNEPLYIIELGTGSGQFTYNMVKALHELKVSIYLNYIVKL